MFECRGTYEAEINYSVCLLTEMHLPHLGAIQYTLRVISIETVGQRFSVSASASLIYR